VYEHVAPKPLVSPVHVAEVTDVDVDAHLSPQALQFVVVFRSPHPESNGASGDEPSGASGRASMPPPPVSTEVSWTSLPASVGCVSLVWSAFDVSLAL
jgi:hypothetical protein